VGFDLQALLSRDVRLEWVKAHRPVVKIEHQRQEEAEAAGTLARLEAAILRGVVEAYVQMVIAIIEAFFGQSERAVVIGEAAVDEGEICYKAVRGGTDIFETTLRDVRYRAKELEPKVSLDIIRNADVEGTAAFGDNESQFALRNLSRPRGLEIRGVDLGYADRYLRQRDALVVKQGFADVAYGNQTVRLAIRGLELGKNEQAAIGDFFFAGVDRLIAYAEAQKGEIVLEAKVDAAAIRTSDDLRFVAREMWRGMLTEVLERYGEPIKEKIRDVGTTLLRQLLEEREKAAKKGEER
jgi:hypothetical protein